MSRSSPTATIATISIDWGKNSFHLVVQDQQAAIVLRIKLSRPQLVRRLANIPLCLIGMKAYAGTQHIERQLQGLSHDVRLIAIQYVKSFLKGHKNQILGYQSHCGGGAAAHYVVCDYQDPEQMNLLALYRVARVWSISAWRDQPRSAASCSNAASSCV